jgi:outer membrane lipopolysaccharide assembly protein LptE/RlpB
VKITILPNLIRLRSLAVLPLLAVLLTAGCGYHFASSGSGLPAKAQTLYVERFGNHTRLTGVNDEFMRYLKDEIADHKRLELVESPSEADLILSGTVGYVETLPLAFNSVSEPTMYDLTMSADATLVDAHTHKVIWASRGISGSQSFATVAQTVVTTSPTFLRQNLRSQDIAQLPDLQVAETQRASANQQMMQQLAQNLYASMSEGF